MRNTLQELVNKSNSYTEARYHRRSSNSFLAQKGRVDIANHSLTEGVGIRVLVDGFWGFAATTDVSASSLSKTLEKAQRNAKAIARVAQREPIVLSRGRPATVNHVGPGYDKLVGMSIEEKLSSVVDFERRLAQSSQKIQTAKCRYKEIFEDKVVVTSDGAAASMKLAQPEVSFGAVAEANGEQVAASHGAGVSGDWQCLYNHPALDNVIEDTSKLAVDLLKAKYPEGGIKTCILAPSVVGLLCHEAIGHTVEADFVKAGSIAQGKIGERVGSELVNMADSGREEIAGYAVGNQPFDDEGIETETTTIIENGILKSYLHNKESAAEFGVEPTGNARAWLYDDEPIIRMRNTYFLPGESSLAEMIAGVDEGYLVEGAGSGQADSNGEFMFGTSHVWRLEKGQKKELLREVTLSGLAFDVLKTVDAVSQEFRWDLGTGYCGKGQPAKVDAGGPYIRCKINVGGRQS